MEPDIQELKRLYAAAEVGVGTQRDVAVAMNAAYRYLPALIARLETAEAALKAVDGLATCAEVDMSGKVRYRFMTTGQNEVIHQVKAALPAPPEATR